MYFNSNNKNNNDQKALNFISINFLNNDHIIDDNVNEQNIYNVTPQYSKNKLTNKDNNISKSQFQEYIDINYNDIKNYYAPYPANINFNQQNNIIKEINNNNNYDLQLNKNIIQNPIGKININDQLNFDITPQKNIEPHLRKDPFDENINNVDSFDENNINKNDSFEFENNRQDDKKKGKIMDRIVKGRAKLNDNNRNINNIIGSSIEKSKLLEKVVENNNKLHDENLQN